MTVEIGSEPISTRGARMSRKRISLILVVAVGMLLVPASAGQGHSIKKSSTREFAAQIALKKCQRDARCFFWSVDECFRNGPHRVNCVVSRYDQNQAFYCSYWHNERLPRNSNTIHWWISRNTCG
jgi:hypothetical protein